MNIKIKVGTNNKISQDTFDKLVEWGAINLSDRKTTRQLNKRKQEIRNKKIKIFYKKYFKAFILVLFALIITSAIILPILQSNASNGEILSARDMIRKERLETCLEWIKNAWIAKNDIELHQLVIKCALRMHWVYVVESWAWKYEIRENNFLWIKRSINWYYWFHRFNSPKECREYFVSMWVKFHYKKTPKVFIYWYNIDWEWRYGWSATQKESYTKTLTYIESSKKLRKEYEDLYLNN